MFSPLPKALASYRSWGIFPYENGESHFLSKAKDAAEAKAKKVAKVNFATSCSVVLIPSRQEYFAAGIDLWFGQSDQMQAQMQLADEVQTVLYDHPELPIMTALTYLYQPHHSDECCGAKAVIADKKALRMLIVHPDRTRAEQAEATLQLAMSSTQYSLLVKHASNEEQARQHLVDPVDVVMLHEQLVLGTSDEELCRLIDCIHIHPHVVIGLLVTNRSPVLPGSRRPSRAEIRASFSISRDSTDCELSCFSDDTICTSISIDHPPVDKITVSTVGLVQQQRRQSFCPADAQNPIDQMLHEQAQEFNMQFVWREPLDEVVYMLPLLLLEREKKATEAAGGEVSKQKAFVRAKSSFF